MHDLLAPPGNNGLKDTPQSMPLVSRRIYVALMCGYSLVEVENEANTMLKYIGLSKHFTTALEFKDS